MTIASIVGQLLLGWLIADLLSGLVHWFEDRVMDEDWPLVGSIVADSRRHHREPGVFLTGSILERHGASWILVTIASAIWAGVFGVSLIWVAATLGGTLVNEVHRWAHTPATSPRWVRVAQEIGLLQSCREHARHHRPPETLRYCVLTDWLNPVLDTLKVWARLERFIRHRRAAL